MTENPWILFGEIVFAAALLGYFFFRKKSGEPEQEGVQRIEMKLSGAALHPAEIRVKYNRPAQLLVHRFEDDPAEELFEIDDLKVYALLPAMHTTIIPFNPQQRGTFPIVLGGERPAGTVIVE